MSETSNLTGPILKALNNAGYFAMRLNSGSAKRGKYWIQLCPRGTADILLCPPHRAPIWIETKSEDGHTNPEQVMAQANFAYAVESLGHKYVRVTCLDDVLRVI